MLTVVIIGDVSDLMYTSLRTRLDDRVKLSKISPKAERSELQKAVEDAEVIIPFHFPLMPKNVDVYECAKKVRVLQMPWVGVDDIDFEYAKKRGITVCNSYWNSSMVAEFTFSLMLCCQKQIVAADSMMRKGDMNAQKWQAHSMKNSTILLLGYGEIPKELVKFLKPFNAKIIALGSRLRKSNSGKTFGDEVRGQTEIHEIGWHEFNKIAGRCDFVVCALPLTPETKGVLDEKKFAAIKKGAIFVNISRDGVVDEKALFDALKSGHLGGAALDVWDHFETWQEKQYVPNFPFHELPNVVMSPHRAWTMDDSVMDACFWDAAFNNILALLESKPKNIMNIVDLDMKY